MIRSLTIDDIDLFIKIRVDSLKIDPDVFGSSIEDGVDRELTKQRMMKKNNENFILAYFKEKNICGMIGLIRELPRKRNHRAMIWGMFVYPEHRGKGIGSLLMKACIEKAIVINGLKSICLSVSEKAKAAKALYEKMGFVSWGVEKNALKTNDNKYQNEIHMVKFLDS